MGASFFALARIVFRVIYNLKYPPPPPRGGKYHPMSFGGKNMKSGREKEEKCKIKRKKGERKRKKWERIRENGKKKGKINAK